MNSIGDYLGGSNKSKRELDSAVRDAAKGLGLNLEKSRVQIVSPNNFSKITRLPLDAAEKGVFFPRELKGYVIDGDEYSIGLYVHELAGHGGFCETFPLGQKMVKSDARAAAIEEKLFGGLNPSSHLKFFPDSRVGYRVKIDGERETLVTNAEALEYLRTRKETDEIKIRYTSAVEGFAVWIEEKILPQLPAFGTLFTERQIEPYLSGYNRMKEIERKEGLSGVISFLKGL